MPPGALSAVCFALTRDANLVLLPCLAAPLVYCGRRRFILVAILVATTCAIAFWHARVEVRWKPGYRTSILLRTATTPVGRQYLYEAGMPKDPFLQDHDAFLDWLDTNGRRIYTRWFLSRSDSYWRPWGYLYRGASIDIPEEDLVEYLHETYFVKLEAERGRTTLLANWVFRRSALPLLALSLLLPALLALGYHRGRVDLMCTWVILLTAALLLHGFLAFNLSGSAHARHLLPSAVLLRLLPLLAAAAFTGYASGPPSSSEPSDEN